jgi:transcription initiation factor TFIID TATA-box-binding protein
MMDTLTTHPSTAAEARAFTAPHSLSFPGGAGHITPPSEKEAQSQANGQVNGHQPAANGNGPAAAPATPAATPGAGQGVSGIIPTLQNLVATVNLDCRVRTHPA